MLKNIERVTKQQDRDREGPDGRRPARPAAGADAGRAAREPAGRTTSTTFRVVVESLADEFDLVEVALAAVKLAHEAQRRGAPTRRRSPTCPCVPSETSWQGPPRARRDAQERRGRAARPAGMTRIFIGAGRPRAYARRTWSARSPTSPAQRARHRRDRDRRPLLAGRGPRRGRDEVIAALRGSTIKGRKATVRRDRDCEGGRGHFDGADRRERRDRDFGGERRDRQFGGDRRDRR